MNWFTPDVYAGIEQFAKQAGMDDEATETFAQRVLAELDASIRQMKVAMDLGHVKVAEAMQDETLTELDKLIIKAAADPETFTKTAVIKEEACTDSDGNKGSWVLYNSDGSKKLGCHGSREAALRQDKAIQVHKHASFSHQEVIERS